MDKKNLTKAEKIVKAIDENISKMSEEEREEFFKKMGFAFEEKFTEKKEKHHQLIRLKAYLAALYVLNERSTDKQIIEAQNAIPDRKNLEINLLTVLKAVLELRKQSNSNATTTKPTYEEIMKMMEKMDFDDAPVIIEGSHPAKNIPDDEELHASLKYLKRISVAQSQPDPRKYK